MSKAYRISRFVKNLNVLRRHRLVTAHNVRAAWIQSDPFWHPGIYGVDISDEEPKAFIRELRNM